MRRVLYAAVFAAGFLIAGQTASALDSSASAQGFKSGPILRSGTTVDGEALAYPSGASPEVTAAIVTLDPGGRTTLHRHPVPVVAYILEGTLTVREENHAPRTYKQGDSFLETVGHWHQGFNESDKPTRVLAIFLGRAGMATTENKE